jgi:hypothetical protein
LTLDTIRQLVSQLNMHEEQLVIPAKTHDRLISLYVDLAAAYAKNNAFKIGWKWMINKFPPIKQVYPVFMRVPILRTEYLTVDENFELSPKEKD